MLGKLKNRQIWHERVSGALAVAAISAVPLAAVIIGRILSDVQPFATILLVGFGLSGLVIALAMAFDESRGALIGAVLFAAEVPVAAVMVNLFGSRQEIWTQWAPLLPALLSWTLLEYSRAKRRGERCDG